MGERNDSGSVFAIVIAAFVLLLIGVRSCFNFFESSRRAQSRLEPNLPTSLRTQLPPEQQGNRLSIILDSIIFKVNHRRIIYYQSVYLLPVSDLNMVEDCSLFRL